MDNTSRIIKELKDDYYSELGKLKVGYYYMPMNTIFHFDIDDASSYFNLNYSRTGKNNMYWRGSGNLILNPVVKDADLGFKIGLIAVNFSLLVKTMDDRYEAVICDINNRGLGSYITQYLNEIDKYNSMIRPHSVVKNALEAVQKIY